MFFIVKPGEAFRTRFVIALMSCYSKAVENNEHRHCSNKRYHTDDIVAVQMRCQQKYKTNDNGRQATNEGIYKKNHSSSCGWFLASHPGKICFVSVFLSIKHDSDSSDVVVERLFKIVDHVRFLKITCTVVEGTASLFK